MKLRTETEIPTYDFSIHHKTKIMTVGSCFSEVLGFSLQKNKFKVLNNPFGTVYNIRSVSDLLLNAIHDQDLNENWILERDGVFYHHLYHSKIYGFSPDELIEKINQVHITTKRWLSETDILVLTLGTSWVYTLNEKIVSNCHKLPARLFSKRFMPLVEQTQDFSNLIEALRKFNPQLRILLTVSPVRHTKDGLTENSYSKSVLRVLCESMKQLHNHVDYFPSFEIMMDDLRDYRFYKEDLIHPNETAENYILDIFAKSFFTVETQNIVKEWGKLKNSLNHRPLNEKSNSNQQFLLKLKNDILRFEAHFDTSEERNEINSKLERTKEG